MASSTDHMNIDSGNGSTPNPQQFVVRLPSGTGGAFPFTPMESGMTTPFGNGTTPLQYEVLNPATPGLGDRKPTGTDPLVTKQERQQAIAKLGIHDTSVEAVLPALPGQEFHLATWLNSGRTLAEPTWAFKTNQILDEHRLRGAWSALRRRHPVLRATLVATGPDDAFTVVLRQASGASNYATFGKVARVRNVSLDEQVKKSLRQLSTAPSSLTTPPVRLTLIRGGNEGDAVLLTVHHAAADSWSMELLIDELEALYQGRPIASQAPSFKKFVSETLQSNDPEAGEKFWKDAIGHCDETILNESGSNAGTPMSTGEASPALPAALFEVRTKGQKTRITELEAIAEAAGVGIHSILCLAFARVLSEKTGSERPVFGSFRSGRPRGSSFQNLHGLFAPLSNMLPTAVPVAKEAQDKPELVKALKSIEEVRAAQEPFEHTYLRDALRWAGFTAGDGETQVTVPFNTFFNIHWDDGKLQKPTVTKTPLDVKWERMDMGPRVMDAEPRGGRTTVDSLDTGNVMREHNVFIDVKPDRDADVLEFRARADDVLMSEEALRTGLVEKIDDEVAGIVGCLGR